MITWTGGKCPVPEGTKVRYRLRSGATYVYRAGTLEWAHPYGTDPGEIVEYEVVQPENSSAKRKGQPVHAGVMMYFPDALLAVAEHSRKGNEKHNPGEPLHWAKGKSKDQADCIARHLIDIGPNWDAIDPEFGSLHATALAWRALALLQTVLERGKT